MKKLSLRNAVENKYSHLLVSIVVLFLLAPIIQRYIADFPIVHLLLFLIIILTLRIVKVTKPVYLLVICLGAVAVSLEYFINKGAFASDNIALVTLLITYILFIGAAIIFLTKNVFTEKSITGDTIKGGISIYMLMGFWWVFLYYLILALSPGSVVSTLGEQLDFVKLYQYSFATLTTVGYGNIIPKSEMAITLSNFEAVAGQIYLTVFIARLVGMHLVAKSRARNE